MMNINDLENRLQKNAVIVKEKMIIPSTTEREDFKMKSKRLNKKMIAVIAAVVCVLCTSVFAAVYRYLSAKDAALALDEPQIASLFKDDAKSYETVIDGEYKATVLGVESGENFNGYWSDEFGTHGERTYAVVAVEKTDGTPMTYEDELMVTPLFSGNKPWQTNIATLHGGFTAKVIDGVLYRIIDLDSIEQIDCDTMYMAVVSEAFINNTQYIYDEQTGEISVNEEYDGTNILIKLDR